MLVRKFMSNRQQASKQLFWEEKGSENWDVTLQGKWNHVSWWYHQPVPKRWQFDLMSGSWMSEGGKRRQAVGIPVNVWLLPCKDAEGALGVLPPWVQIPGVGTSFLPASSNGFSASTGFLELTLCAWTCVLLFAEEEMLSIRNGNTPEKFYPVLPKCSCWNMSWVRGKGVLRVFEIIFCRCLNSGSIFLSLEVPIS